MTKKLITYSIKIILLFVGVLGYSQQDAQYTHYMYNMSVINPGYATDDLDLINLGLLHRAQWVGSVGGPTTSSFFAHTSLGNKIEGGISAVHDQIGDVVKETNLFADFAYAIPFSENTKLSFGVKAGATFFSTNFNGFVYSDDLPDPAFANNLSKTYPNIGVGAFYFGKQFYLGFSAPNLLESEHLDNDSGIVTSRKEETHLFFTAGYVYNINEKIKLKPAMMTKAVSGSPLSLDLTTNVLINDVFEIGVGYRFDDSISGLVNFRVIDSLRIGYAYDYTLSNLGNFNTGSHEIILLFDIGKPGNGYDKSPRFF
ncbi:type IX secretion system membrane protein PorP/SprF [Psychroserpens burtonensis]|uniref:Type IX secretion system membrane protein PorP/SprF n=1 Tax=Psychroserpens burtonensis TaxID=49278 RepID=A0A5C7BDK4_9FLAO|nr:type IX secretion system membrane protein PorP/SprF [Psychroserpens burtonensis]TXE18769.1 type IX secretion system membrane protein PorP/SprF [Psychroserpens burtonensis]